MSSLPEQDKKSAWVALSDIFIDNEVDYPAVAQAVRAHGRPAVERMFFEEVAPVCYANLQAPVPPIWAGFDATVLISDIEGMLSARAASRTRRWRDRLLIAYLRWFLRDEWARLEAELVKMA